MPGTSTPLTPTQIRAALKKFEVKANYIDGWETRNRGDRGNGFGPVYGFMVHHTGDDAPDSADRRVIINGRSDLPGPLAQFGLNDDGTVDVIGCGRANHAGTGDSKVLAQVRDEDPALATRELKPVLRDYDGNGRFYGVEAYYSGSNAPVQYVAMVNLAAAICDAHGWTGLSVIGHREWSSNKWDPGKVDMVKFRKDVDARIKAVNYRLANPVTPAPKPVTSKIPAPQKYNFDARIVVDNEALRLGQRSSSARIFNLRVWSWLYWAGGSAGRKYCEGHYAAWMKESSSVFGRQSLLAMQEVYQILHYRNAKAWPTSQTTNPKPTWPGPALLRELGMQAD